MDYKLFTTINGQDHAEFAGDNTVKIFTTDFKIAPACMGTLVSVNGQLRTRISGLYDCICPLTISAMNYL